MIGTRGVLSDNRVLVLPFVVISAATSKGNEQHRTDTLLAVGAIGHKGGIPLYMAK